MNTDPTRREQGRLAPGLRIAIGAVILAGAFAAGGLFDRYVLAPSTTRMTGTVTCPPGEPVVDAYAQFVNNEGLKADGGHIPLQRSSSSNESATFQLQAGPDIGSVILSFGCGLQPNKRDWLRNDHTGIIPMRSGDLTINCNDTPYTPGDNYTTNGTCNVTPSSK